MKPSLVPRITLFLSTSLTLPVVQMLQERQLLAGVVITPRMDADSVQLEQSLKQMQVPATRYHGQKMDLTLQHIRGIAGNIGLIVTFSLVLPEAVLDCFEYGLFNIHASPLPRYRGCNPLFWQIKNAESSGAIVVHKVETEVDCGGIVVSYPFDLHPLETLGTLVATSFQLMPVVIHEFLALFIQHGGDVPLQQQEGEISLAPNPTRADICVDWSTMEASEIVALSRACNPGLGGAQILWKKASIGLMQAGVVAHQPTFGVEAGVIVHIGEPEGLLVATVDGVVAMEVLYMMDGVFSGLHFAERFSLNAGDRFQ